MTGTGDDDDCCTADYGVFGWNSCTCPVCKPQIPKRDLRREQADTRYRQRLERERRASSAFNSHMIDLYNQGRKP